MTSTETRLLKVLAFVLVLCLAGSASALAQGRPAGGRTPFVQPPRSIVDITELLDKETFDKAKRAEILAQANAEPGAGVRGATLAGFYYARARARAALGRTQESIADCERAVPLSADYTAEGSRIEQFMEIQLRLTGNFKGAIELLNRTARKLDIEGTTNRGRAPYIYGRLAYNYILLGDLQRGEAYLRRSEGVLAQVRSIPGYQPYLTSFESNIEEIRAFLVAARGRWAEAETAFRRAANLYADAMQKSRSWPNASPQASFQYAVFSMTIGEARTKIRLGRLAEAEVDLRRALLGRLKLVGTYHPDIAQVLYFLAEVMDEQSRHVDAEALARKSIEIHRAIGYREDGQQYVGALNALARSLYSQGRFTEAREAFAAFDRATNSWTRDRIARARSSAAVAFTLYYTQDVEKGIELAREALAFQRALKGEQHVDTALARAVLAAGLSLARQDAEALGEFKAAIPLLLATTRDVDDDDTTSSRASDLRLRNVIEAAIALFARLPDTQGAAAEGLRLADAIRARSVQGALAAASARAAARSPALAELARKDQDLQKQIAALTSLIGEVLSLPADQREDKALKQLQQDLEKAKTDRRAAKREIDARFPEYANLTRPLPVTAKDMASALRPDEALVSFYFGARNSFAWSMQNDGQIAFAALPLTASEVEARVAKLRAPFEADIASIGDIPPFDLQAAHDLYKLILEPIRQGWQPAKTLLVVTNGPLGLLPLGLLPTEPSEIKEDGGPHYSSYRKVAWLARTHAVVSLPSASALRTLRVTQAPAKRDALIGFGDPLFSSTAMTVARTEPSIQTAPDDLRSARIKLRALPRLATTRSANVGMLPQLPDTADELKAIAVALQTDPAKVLYLGKAASEKTVKSLDLARYRIVAFATHGLVPGDLDGLTQPALALSAPEIVDADDDGLLTMEEILGLRLNADWVVLSACNTGSGAAPGADAASGLGRAFFYAGSRALLLTNWSVHSVSAAELVAGVFRRQAADPQLTRAEALRQSMMALLDGPGAKDDAGKTIFTYGHPLFWAPYSIMGDGGAG